MEIEIQVHWYSQHQQDSTFLLTSTLVSEQVNMRNETQRERVVPCGTTNASSRSILIASFSTLESDAEPSQPGRT